jgi:YggT family protein
MRDLLCLALGLFQLAILIRIILSWFPLDPNGAMARVSGVLRTITDPVLEPVRRILPRTGFIDLSPLLVLIAISLVQSLVLRCGPGFF